MILWSSLVARLQWPFLIIFPFFAMANPEGNSKHIDQIVISFPHQLDNSEKLYPAKLLRAALEASGITFILKTTLSDMSQDRNLREIALGNNVDVIWTMTNIERELKLRPIRIPIDKGLYGWRLLLVRENDESLNKIRKVIDFKKLIFLQGHDWPDTEILKANKLSVVTSDNYQHLFSMIQKNRADVLPRSVLEINHEQVAFTHQLKVHPSVSIYYPTAMYYFVSKSNDALAAQIEIGLNRLIASGDFERLFQEEFGDDIKKAMAAGRTVIQLINPYLPAETPLNRAELWQFNQDVIHSFGK